MLGWQTLCVERWEGSCGVDTVRNLIWNVVGCGGGGMSRGLRGDGRVNVFVFFILIGREGDLSRYEPVDGSIEVRETSQCRSGLLR
jgi:hypothetical protein